MALGGAHQRASKRKKHTVETRSFIPRFTLALLGTHLRASKPKKHTLSTVYFGTGRGAPESLQTLPMQRRGRRDQKALLASISTRIFLYSAVLSASREREKERKREREREREIGTNTHACMYIYIYVIMEDCGVSGWFVSRSASEKFEAPELK